MDEIKKITKLAIFDFDGTLVDTPVEEFGRKLYQEKTGNKWPHVGWWGRHESLDMEVFEIPTVEAVIKDYEKEFADENTAVILLTGRMVGLTTHVMAILKAKGLTFDDYHLNRGGKTEDAKVKSMEKLLEKYKDATYIEMWDDRLGHIPIFEAWGAKQLESGRLTHFKINVVPTADGGRH